MTDQETHYDDSVEDPESKLLSSPPRRLRRIRISPDLEHDEATVPILEQFRMMPWERLGILGLVALIIIAATVLATTVLGGRNGATYDVDGVENTSPPYFTGLSVIDLTKLCPEGATSFDPSKLPFNVFQRQGDFAAMLAAEVMDGADLDPYSCSPQNLAVLWLAAHPPQTLLQDTLARRYVLTAFYFSLKGWLWKEDGNWLHEDDECTWNGITCNQNGAVTSISLKHNNLKGSLPEELRHLSLLEAFHVSQNSISGTLPTALSKLPKLVELEVSLNEFTGTVPIELFKQSHLKKLDLAYFGGTLETIPTEVGRLSALEWFMAPKTNVVGSLPTELGRCGALRFLDLSHNQLEADIPTELGRLGKLQTLYLTENFLEAVPEEVCSLMESGSLLAFDMKALCNSRRVGV